MGHTVSNSLSVSSSLWGKLCTWGLRSSILSAASKDGPRKLCTACSPALTSLEQNPGKRGSSAEPTELVEIPGGSLLVGSAHILSLSFSLSQTPPSTPPIPPILLLLLLPGGGRNTGGSSKKRQAASRPGQSPWMRRSGAAAPETWPPSPRSGGGDSHPPPWQQHNGGSLWTPQSSPQSRPLVASPRLHSSRLAL